MRLAALKDQSDHRLDGLFHHLRLASSCVRVICERAEV